MPKFRNKPKALTGRDALLDTDLLQYKPVKSHDDTESDDEISIGASTLGLSTTEKMKTSEIEAELSRIKEVCSYIATFYLFCFRV